MAEHQREYFPVHFSLLFKHKQAIPYRKKVAEIFDVLYNACLLKTYQFHNKFTVVYQITMRAKLLLHSDRVTYVTCAPKLTRVAVKITPPGRELPIITAGYAPSQLSPCT